MCGIMIATTIYNYFREEVGKINCLNPVVKFENEIYQLVLSTRKDKFKNYLHLSEMPKSEQDLVAFWTKLGYVTFYKCNKCLSCLHTKKIDWFRRCCNEARNWKNIYFITLTFDNDHYELHNKKRLLSIWVQNKLRRYLGKDNFKYFAVSEYGAITNRFHYHLLLFTNLYFCDLVPHHYSKKHNLQYVSSWLVDNWQYGLHTIDRVRDVAAFKYCVKYATKSQNLKVYCTRGFGNFINDMDSVDFSTLPRSILINAYARCWNARKRYKRHEISGEQLLDVLNKNEPYNVLKERYLSYWRIHAIKNWANTTALAKLYASRYMHVINTKLQL